MFDVKKKNLIQATKQLTDLVLMSEEGQNFPVHKAGATSRKF